MWDGQMISLFLWCNKLIPPNMKVNKLSPVEWIKLEYYFVYKKFMNKYCIALLVIVLHIFWQNVVFFIGTFCSIWPPTRRQVIIFLANVLFSTISVQNSVIAEKN